MYKEVLESMQGIGLYGIISICLFFVFFAGVLVWSCALKKNYLNTMGHLPLEDANPPMPLSPLEPWTLRPLESSDNLVTGDHSPSLSAIASATADPRGEGRGEGEQVTPQPAFSPMGNHHQKL
jgi:hypothetical protein